ncbi:glycoside hydrolase [Paenibacillus alvei]|uniref:glycoside hydrolase family 38 N-terminal domain-containing protein n=1 Tax=Paenibacillus alvei TaxID=44250 RepID=UPI0021D0163B|nr:glycoside hydrolase family 38 C-terminal domain-containing protein [Paenibacillus alvei]MCY9539672.1 glycoside hydrolase [Paenibacillus alvei]MCY9703195.1 glycoside hydrolase [Paenibacillus alvei]MCY9735585.1 glycoside hydrolase [Paenibacillus alvei]MCY9752934.1 glycoside hydrolase [Paenibacillus alvei]MEC0081169.1 glycoside hydrolase family 38 C-terminal domain-containing protein [Paenibacillus alvei]
MRMEQHLARAKTPTPNRAWTIYAIHHSHTDIGYTERQEKIERYHAEFIRQALSILQQSENGAKPDWQGFRWNCETFWAVERFLDQASEKEREQFAAAVRSGSIELSDTYLNMTELPDYSLLQCIHSKAQAYAKSIGHQIDSAMTADINGYGWGYAQSLLDNGIKHLFSCIHTHHGMFALGRKQTPFWWQAPNGDRLLVWNGEHYMFGNELGLCPGALGQYMIQDEFDNQLIDAHHNDIARIRMHRYVCRLEEEGYPYDFVPVMLSGLGTDNASPNGRIMEFIRDWNAQYGETIRIEMTTLSGFFARLKQEDMEQLPVYAGDWPDWWSDGVSSTAMHTQLYRDAQRTLRKVKYLDPKRELVDVQQISEAEQALVMYAEHTWGYHSSIYEPWHPNVQLLEVRKQAYAADASRLAHQALDQVLFAQGAAPLYPERPIRYRIVNTENASANKLVTLPLDGWEPALFEDGMEVVHEGTGAVLPHQSPHPQSIVIQASLDAGGECFLKLRKTQTLPINRTTSNTRLMGSDRVYDMDDLQIEHAAHGPIRIAQHMIESPFVRIEWKEHDGIISWLDKQSGAELLAANREYGAFTPIYEVTPVADSSDPSQVWAVRSRMGRNRKGINVERSAGCLIRVRPIENGPLYATVELTYTIEGMSYYALFLKVYATSNRVEVSVRLHKDSVWLPENVYVALPFTTGEYSKDTLYVEKAGAIVRPWIDQLPGTCLDYTCIQEGLAWSSHTGAGLANSTIGSEGSRTVMDELEQATERTLLLAMPDTPLLQLGSLDHGRRIVHTQQAQDTKPSAYAWLMTNYWETNFKATLGGFYEFRYALELRHDVIPTEQLPDEIPALAAEFIVARMN